MSDDDLRAELERLRQENETLKKGASRGRVAQGEREGGAIGVWAGAFPGDPLQGTVGQAARHVRRHPGVPQGARLEAQEQGVTIRLRQAWP